MFLEYYIYYFYYSFLGFPFIIRIAVTAILIYTPFFLYNIYALSSARNHFYKKKKLEKRIREKYNDKLISIFKSKDNYSFSQMKDILDCKVNKLSNYEKRLLTNAILNIKENLDVINLLNYQTVIQFFGLVGFWESKLKYGRIGSKQKALRKLDDLDIDIPGSIITSLTYNRNQYLRKKARASYIYFSNSNPYKFLDEEFDKTFNEWDKIEIHRMLSRRKETEGLPNLNQWIKNSKNSDFKCFLVDEIMHFNQKECSSYLLELTKQEDIQLRKHCINALGEMKYQEAEETLKEGFALQPQAIKQSIINTIQKLSTGKALPFLKEAYLNAHDVETRKITLEAIYNYGNTGKDLFYSMKKSSSGFSKLIFEHACNPLIKYK